jgi:peptidoglycan/LPS O-acetylase OafA/YrhL
MGPLRLFLAMSVMFFHIGKFKWFPTVPADFAVNSFFVMSGFYISLGLNERYKIPANNVEFYIGRVLRLWPIYLFSIAILFPTGILTQIAHRILELPTAMMVLAFFSNIFIFGSDLLLHMSAVDGSIRFSEFGVDPNHNGANVIVNLPVWTLSMEVLFYTCAPFIVRNFKRSIIFFCIGAFYLFGIRYFANLLPPLRTDLYYPGPAFFFGLGTLGYWIHRKFPLTIKKNVIAYLILFGMVLLGSGNLLYATAFFSISVLARPVFDRTKRNKVDQWFGDLSYPLYILHIPITILVRSQGYFEVSTTSYFLSIIFGTLVVVYLVERPINNYRSRLRKRKLQKSRTPPLI